MKLRKLRKLVVVCIIVGACFALSGAASANGNEYIYMRDLNCEQLDMSAVEHKDGQGIARVTGSINESISGLSSVTVGDSFTLVANDIITYNCSYTPKTASVDFGFIAPDGYFYSTNVTTGKINKSIRVSQTGTYTLAIRNNASDEVTVTGTVSY